MSPLSVTAVTGVTGKTIPRKKSACVCVFSLVYPSSIQSTRVPDKSSARAFLLPYARTPGYTGYTGYTGTNCKELER